MIRVHSFVAGEGLLAVHIVPFERGGENGGEGMGQE